MAATADARPILRSASPCRGVGNLFGLTAARPAKPLDKNQQREWQLKIF